MSYQDASYPMSKNPDPGSNNVDDLSNTMSSCNIGSTTNNLSIGGINASRMMRSKPSIRLQSTSFRQNSQAFKQSSSTIVPNDGSFRRFEFKYGNEIESKRSGFISTCSDVLKKSGKSLSVRLNKGSASKSKNFLSANKSTQSVSTNFVENPKRCGTKNGIYDSWQNKSLANANNFKTSLVKPKGNKSSNKNISMKYNLSDYKTKSSKQVLNRSSIKNNNVSCRTQLNTKSR